MCHFLDKRKGGVEVKAPRMTWNNPVIASAAATNCRVRDEGKFGQSGVLWEQSERKKPSQPWRDSKIALHSAATTSRDLVRYTKAQLMFIHAAQEHVLRRRKIQSPTVTNL